MLNLNATIQKKENSIFVLKDNGTSVNYYLQNHFEVHYNELPSGIVQDWHVHVNIEEAILVIKGNLILEQVKNLKIDTISLCEGDFVILNNSIHRILNNNSEVCDFVVFRFSKNKNVIIKEDKISFSDNDITLLTSAKRCKHLCVLSDLDGTIIPKKEKKISEKARFLISFMKQEGLISNFIIATGRNVTSFTSAIKKYNIDFFDYAICSNGAAIVDNAGKIINIEPLSSNNINNLKILVDRFSNHIFNHNFGVIQNSNQNITYSLTVSIKDKKWQKIFIDHVLSKCDVAIKSNGIYIDITNSGLGKWSSFTDNISKKIITKKTIGFGDSDNDIDILENCSISISFSFASESAKKSSSMLCNSFEEGLLVAAIKF